MSIKEQPKMTHKELVERAAAWLAYSRSCPVVITEMGSDAREEPDAIGFMSSGETVLVECKTSITDFKADFGKHGRCIYPRFGMGNQRFFLVPDDIADFVSENRPAHWGVLVCRRTKVEIRERGDFIEDTDKIREIVLLISSIRRIAGTRSPLTGMNVKCYRINSNCRPRATMGVELPQESER